MNDRVDLERLLAPEPSHDMSLANEAAQGTATVLEVGEATILARCGERTIAMRLAASCMLLPAAGDRVWWCSDRAGGIVTHWVTHLLERADMGPATIQLPGNVTLRTSDGFLRIAAGDLQLEADSLQIKAGRARVLFDTAEAIGTCWQGVIGALRWTGSSIATVVDRITTVAGTHQRFTEGSDTVCAGTLDLRAQGLATLHGEHVLLEGERLLKSRAPQIHMG